jgi:hypothetical protein
MALSGHSRNATLRERERECHAAGAWLGRISCGFVQKRALGPAKRYAAR